MSYDQKKIYHITHIDNLQGIIDSDGIVCKNEMSGKKYNSIAFDSLQDRRAGICVPVKPDGTLHDYVPFFFCTKPPMLFTISRNNVKGAENTQNSIIYFVTTIDDVERSEAIFVFTDGHAIMVLTDFYNDLCYLDKIDWDVINSWYWADTEDDPDRKRKKQAEFLIYKKAPLKIFNTIVCQNKRTHDIIERCVSKKHLSSNISVEINPDWYYSEQ